MEMKEKKGPSNEVEKIQEGSVFAQYRIVQTLFTFKLKSKAPYNLALSVHLNCVLCTYIKSTFQPL
jgi:hypothetical protein